jgi:hypothetical protein
VTEKKLRSFPRPAIKAIAASGVFCGLMTCFLVYYAWRMGFATPFVVLNAATALFLFVGSGWMLLQLRKA